MKSREVLFLPGDGIGPEVSNEARKVLEYLNDAQDLGINISQSVVGGCAYEEFGKPLPEATLEAAKKSDAILLGAVGGPAWDNLNMT